MRQERIRKTTTKRTRRAERVAELSAAAARTTSDADDLLDRINELLEAA